MLLLIFACSNSDHVESSKLVERGGLVYYNKSDTPFTGKGIKYVGEEIRRKSGKSAVGAGGTE